MLLCETYNFHDIKHYMCAHQCVGCTFYSIAAFELKMAQCKSMQIVSPCYLNALSSQRHSCLQNIFISNVKYMQA